MPERKPNSRNTPNPLRTLAAVYIIMAPDGRRYIGSSTRVATNERSRRGAAAPETI